MNSHIRSQDATLGMDAWFSLSVSSSNMAETTTEIEQTLTSGMLDGAWFNVVATVCKRVRRPVNEGIQGFRNVIDKKMVGSRLAGISFDIYD